MSTPHLARLARARIYTTGQVAKLMNVAPRTVTKWIDCGKLKGYRMPGGNDRRIPHANIAAFCREHGLPYFQDEIAASVAVLVVAPDPALPLAILAATGGAAAVRQHGDPFDAGRHASDLAWGAVVIDLGPGRSAGLLMAAAMRKLHPRAYVVALASEDEHDFAPLRDAGFDDAHYRPFDPDAVAAAIVARLADLAA